MKKMYLKMSIVSGNPQFQDKMTLASVAPRYRNILVVGLDGYLPIDK
jgi:hypothetical protein